MHTPARGSVLARFFLFLSITIGIAFSFLAVFPALFSSPAHAQDYASSEQISSSFLRLNTDPDVPQDLHTLTQAVTIEIMSAIVCQISGINAANPSLPCLSFNPQTNKLGYVMTSEKEPQLGGALGFLTGSIATLYTPAVRSSDYVRYLSDNFGIVKKANAQPAPQPGQQAQPQQNQQPQQGQQPQAQRPQQQPGIQAQNPQQNRQGYGFGGLAPIRDLWQLTRDVAYSFLVLVFILIGVGVMLRIKIDPRTVMTIQNQIPRVVIALLLITFSYAIAGLMIDIMWAGTYVGINAVADKSGLQFTCDDGNGEETKSLSAKATGQLVDTPIGFFNKVFSADDRSIQISDGEDNDCGWTREGIYNTTTAVGNALGDIVENLLKSLVLTNPEEECLKPPFSINLGSCILKGLGGLVGWVMRVIILVAIFIALFRVWFELLKAYIYILLYVIAAPIWIMMGLVPGRPLGWENWLRLMFVNLAVFPLTAVLFVVARVMIETFGDKPDVKNSFVPPLTGNPNMEHFGMLIAFGILLMAPGMLTMLREKLKVPGIKGGAIGGSVGQAAGVASAPASKIWAHATRKDPKTGAGIGVISRPITNANIRVLEKFAQGKSKLAEKAGSRLERIRNRESGYAPFTNEEMRMRGMTPTSERQEREKRSSQPNSQNTPPPQSTSGAKGPVAQQGAQNFSNANFTAAHVTIHGLNLPEALKSSPHAQKEGPGVLKRVVEKIKQQPWKDTPHDKLLPSQIIELNRVVNEAKREETQATSTRNEGGPSAQEKLDTAGQHGAQGATGHAGIPGAEGPTGQHGTQGAAGAPGGQGPAGHTGTPGATGTPGGQGPTGQHGTQGAAGTPGATGAPGIAGTQGAQGAQGTAGSQGAPGERGPAGHIPNKPITINTSILGKPPKEGE